jgi:hypothetical protein
MAASEEDEMFSCTKELRLEEALADPIIRRVMSADHVDPRMLEASLRATARKIGPARHSTREAMVVAACRA